LIIILKKKIGLKFYFRYCDDIVILHKSKKRLHYIKNLLKKRLKGIKLQLKQNWQVFPVEIRGIDFLGYRMFSDYTILRKNIAIRMKKKFRKLNESQNVINIVMSYYGWANKANCQNLLKFLISKKIKLLMYHVAKIQGIPNPRYCIRGV